MRKYSYIERGDGLLTWDIVNLLIRIHEQNVQQRIYVEAQPETFMDLADMAKTQNIKTANGMEGIRVSEDRLKKLIQDKTIPRTEKEQKVAGYREAWNIINENYTHILVKPSNLLEIHRNLYKFHVLEKGGNYRETFGVTKELERIPKELEKMCETYIMAAKSGKVDLLLVIPMFILDFLYIYPFDFGTRRMSYLLTMLLLYQAGYYVGRYISIEKIIEQSKEEYEGALQESIEEREKGKNYDGPFVKYILEVINKAYEKFLINARLLTKESMSKPQRIAEFIKSEQGKITKAEIMQRCPNVSQVTVQRTLNELMKKGDIVKLSGGRYTSYIWNRENR